MKLLCAADVHLGRQPSRLPEDLAGRARELGPAAAWRRLVEVALEEQVDALLLAGDVVDHDDDFFEAYADLRQGIERLVEAEVRVVAVAGNHDTRVLPRLVEAVQGVTAEGFTLLGRGGVWETTTLTGRDGVRVEVLGWSFPGAVALDDPLASGLPPRGPEPIPRIGLLHCDRDQTGSRYAPVRTAELTDAPVNAWLLGHVHKSDIAPAEHPMGYLGSLVGTDPGEPGAHGAWLLEVAANGRLGLRSVPLAPLRWEVLDVPLDGIDDVEDVRVAIVRGVGSQHRELAETGLQASAVGLRLAFVGRTGLRAEIAPTLTDDARREIRESIDGTDYFVHAWSLDAAPAYDLAALAADKSPVGLLAAKLLLLDAPHDDHARRALIDEARRDLERAVADLPVSDPAAVAPDEEHTVALLKAAGLEALDRLLARRGSGSRQERP